MKPLMSLKIFSIFFLAAVFFGFSNGISWATPSSQALFTEFDLGGGLWRYDYTVYNTSDPLSYAGYDIFDFTLYLAPTVTFTNILSPPDWFSFSGSGDPSIPLPSFIEWILDFGAEITPGGSLSGFSFQVSYQSGDLPFDVYLTNPIGDPVLYSGNTAPIPEPGSLLLLSSGLVGLGYFRGRKFLKLKLNIFMKVLGL
jgi:hypothetical protein